MKFDQSIARYFVELPLKGVTRIYPNLIQHLCNGDTDIQSPQSLHPTFYGCYDWHSCVHGYWLLAKCANQFPNLPENKHIVSVFETHFTSEFIQKELDYFKAEGRMSFSRPYGWAWILALSGALKTWTLPNASIWYDHLQSLTLYLRDQFISFLPKQTYPIRVGTHFNTAFALLLAREYAVLEEDHEFLDLINQISLKYFLHDTDYPAHYEPNGDDFLSGALIESVLMSQVLSKADFTSWLANFFPNPNILASLLIPVHISDRSDPKIGHLDGLNLSKSWCLKKLIPHLSEITQCELRDNFEHSAAIHLNASIEQIANGHYTGEHWLATYAYLALNA